MTANRDLGKLVPLPSVAGQFVWDQVTSAWVQVTKAMVGLPLADNTADNAKPVSGPQLTALNLKAPIASPALTGVVSVGPDSPLAISGGLGGSIKHNKTAAGGQFDIDDVPFTNTDPAQFRFHRNTSTSGSVTVTYYRGNASTNADHIFISAGTNAATTSEARLCIGAGKAVVGAGAVDATATLLVSGALKSSGPAFLGQYTLTTLPSASTFSGYYITVTNATGGAKLCYSNGTNWLIANTTTIVS